MDVMEVTLAERGQIVIPKEARDALGFKPPVRGCSSVSKVGGC